MKAGIFNAPKDIVLKEIDKPIIGENDVLVKNVRAGICGTDLTAYLYDGAAVGIFPNCEFGHEMVGVVEEVGKNVKGIAAGTRVFVNPATCKKEGAIKCDIAGAFSEYVCVENAKMGYNLFKLNDDISFDEAVVIEPYSVAIHGKNRIDVVKGEHVVIYGAGPIGLCALSAVVNIGITDAVVIDINDERLGLVKEMGGVPFNSTKGDTQEFLKQHFGVGYHHLGLPVADVDAVIDCAGAPQIMQDFITNCKHNSRLSVIAVAKQPMNLYAALIMSSEAIIKGSCAYEIKDIEEAIDSLNNHRTQINKIVTHHFKHSELVKALEFASNPANKSIKVVIDYE